MNLRQIICLLALPILMSGCVTHSLWEEGRFASFREPADPPHLALYESGTNQAILVAYDEANEQATATRRHFYWVNLDRAPIKNPHKPKFISAGKQSEMTRVPIFTELSAEVSTNSLYALSTNESFTIFTTEEKFGPFELPVYETPSGRTKQVLLTPLAVAADATIVGGVLFLWWWSHCGCPESF